MVLDVIIPTKNSADVLERCLISLKKQTNPVRIIIIDGCSTDNTLEIAKKYGCEIYDEPKSLYQGSKRAVACNQSLKHIFSDLVAFLDSDTEVPPKWAEDMEQTFTNLNEFGKFKIGGISSGCVQDMSTDLSRSINTIMKIASNHAQNYDDYKIVDSLPGYNSVYRSSVLSEIGGFNEEIGGCEDWELNYRLRKKGYTLMGVPDSPVIHHERKTIEQFQKQMFGYGWSWGRLLRVKHIFKLSRALPTISLLIMVLTLVLGYFYPILTLPSLLFSVGSMLSLFILDWEFDNKYFILIKVFVSMQLSFAVGYIKALLP
jgi:cellulose synthase/poly-beta-1,6-N-acetylglucosamine synthase-like glycosyltransferase